MVTRALIAATLTVSVACGAATSRADEAIEKPTVAKLLPANGHRLYAGDFASAHGVDAKVHVIDGDTLKLLGNFSNGSFGAYTVSKDGKTVYNATSFFSRGDHGVRTEVLEFYDTATLNVTGEITLPASRAQTVGYPAFLVESANASYIFVQNATPASSITVVDLAQKKVLAEIPTAGCFGIYPSSTVAGRFSTLCGDGSAVTISFDPTGKETGRKRSEKLFDPDKDALFISGVSDGAGKTLFVSFLGNIHPIDFSGEVAAQEAPWPIVTGKDVGEGWRPGGYQLASYDTANGMLYVGMHPKGKEGSHKNAAKQIWKIDVAKHAVVGKGPGAGAGYLVVTNEAHPLLFALDGVHQMITKIDGDKLTKLGTTPKHWVIEGSGVLAVQ